MNKLAKKQQLHINSAIYKVDQILGQLGYTSYFETRFSEILVDLYDNDFISFTITVVFSYGNVSHNHVVTLGWNPDDGIGLEIGEDGELIEINCGNLFRILYSDLALTDLDDKYIN